MKNDVKALLSKVEQKLMRTLHEKPSKETLNRLAIFAGFQDWQSFRDEMGEAGDDKAEAAPKEEENSK